MNIAQKRNIELAQNMFILTIGKICTQCASFFLLPLYTALLSTEEYGLVDLYTTYISLLMPCILLQIDQALFRFLIEQRRHEKGQDKIITTTFIFAILQSSVFLLVFLVFRNFINIEYSWLFVLNCFSSIWVGVLLQVPRGLGNNIHYAIASFLSAFFQIVFNIIFIVFFHLGAAGMLGAMLAGRMVAILYLIKCENVIRLIHIRTFDKKTLKSLLKYSLPLVPNALSWWTVSASDRLIISVFLGTSANGIIAVSHKFSNIYITFYNIFNMSWTESAALHMNDADREFFFSDVIERMCNFFGSIGIGIIACMPFVFPLLINSAYIEAYEQIPIYMVASILNTLVGLYSVIYVALKKTKEIAKTSIMAGVINIAIDFLLIKYIGLYAASISSVLAYGIMWIYRCYDLKKYIKIKLKRWTFPLMMVMIIMNLVSYYQSNMVIHIIDLLVTVVYAVVINRNLLHGGINMILRRISKKARAEKI